MTQTLVLVDLQKGVLSEPGTWDADGVVRRAADLAERARARGVPVVWVQHSSEYLVRGTDGWALASGLEPRADEQVVHKRYPDSFEETTLKEVLGEATQLVIAGAQTDACIRATVHGALVRGFDVTLVSDGHTTGEFPAEYTGGEMIRAKTKIEYTNSYVEWGTTYPGRKGRVRAAADIDFRD